MGKTDCVAWDITFQRIDWLRKIVAESHADFFQISPLYCLKKLHLEKMEFKLPLCANGNRERFCVRRSHPLVAVDAIFRLIRALTAISQYIGYCDAFFGNNTAGLEN
jgi:hypothetical protein